MLLYPVPAGRFVHNHENEKDYFSYYNDVGVINFISPKQPGKYQQ